MSGSGRLEAIWIKRVRRGPMDPVERATLVEGRGIVGNADQGGWRQVTLVEREVFERLQDDLTPGVDPAMRRANLLVSGVPLADSRAQLLHVGPCTIELRGETRPCERMDQALPGLRDALAPRGSGGAFGKVIAGGEIRVGDPVWLEPAASSADPPSGEGSAQEGVA